MARRARSEARGTTGGGGSTGTAGTGGGAINCTVAVATAADVNILDWTGASGTTAPAFGNYMPGTYGGGTFEYPDRSRAARAIRRCTCAPTSTVRTGTSPAASTTTRASASTFTSKTDASMFTGLQFDIQGTFTATGAGDGGVAAASVT